MNIDLADTKYNKPVSSVLQKSRDPLKIILILAFIGVLVWIGFLYFQKITLEKENTLFETSISSTSKRIQEITHSDNPAKKIVVLKVLKKLKAKRMIWSEVMAKIIKLESPGISFQDFSATPEGEIQAIVSAKSFNSIQQFITKLNMNEDVSRIVIHSINIDEKSSGLKVNLNFNLNT
jgi:Tfp pilus assembly protein PilN